MQDGRDVTGNIHPLGTDSPKAAGAYPWTDRFFVAKTFPFEVRAQAPSSLAVQFQTTISQLLRSLGFEVVYEWSPDFKVNPDDIWDGWKYRGLVVGERDLKIGVGLGLLHYGQFESELLFVEYTPRPAGPHGELTELSAVPFDLRICAGRILSKNVGGHGQKGGTLRVMSGFRDPGADLAMLPGRVADSLSRLSEG